MDTLTFVSKLIEALAWPLSVAAVAWILRAELRHLLQLLRKLKAGPVEAEFDREVLSLRVGTEAHHTTSQKEPTHSRGELDPMLELAARHPRSAVLEAWREVEIAMLKLANSRDLLPPGIDAAPSRHVIPALAKEHLIPLQDQALYYELRELRNKAAHAIDFEPSTEAASDYVKMAQTLVDSTKKAVSRVSEG